MEGDRAPARRFNGAHVNATSFNRRVLLTGEAPNEDAKKQIEETVRVIENVKEVTNELQVAGASSLASRGNDSLVTSNVKARMVNNGKFSPQHVKVVTEAGVVYLHGHRVAAGRRRGGRDRAHHERREPRREGFRIRRQQIAARRLAGRFRCATDYSCIRRSDAPHFDS